MGRKTKLHPPIRVDWSHHFKFYCKTSTSQCSWITGLPSDSVPRVHQQPMNFRNHTPVFTALDSFQGCSSSLTGPNVLLKGEDTGNYEAKACVHRHIVGRETLPENNRWTSPYSKQLTVKQSGLYCLQYDEVLWHVSPITKYFTPRRPQNSTKTPK